MSTEARDKVYTVNEYYDGPVLGVADYRGKPHIYKKQFDTEEDEYTDRFLLSPIELDLFALVLEDWEIWLRWDAAYRQGKVDENTHTALPEDRSRHDELVRLIGDRLQPDPEHGLIKWARFRAGQVQWLDARARAS